LFRPARKRKRRSEATVLFSVKKDDSVRAVSCCFPQGKGREEDVRIREKGNLYCSSVESEKKTC